MKKLIAGQELQILLISTQQSLRDEVAQLLSNGRFTQHRLHWISEPHLAAARAQDLLPHVILVDDALGKTDPIPLLRRLATAVSSAAVLFMVEREHLEEASQAVLVGARSFIVKPLKEDELVATLLQVLAWQRVPTVSAEEDVSSVGKVVVFCAPKGGTGRTMLALNTAISLHRLEQQPVVLVDADYAAPALDVALNIQVERDVSDLLSKLSRLDEVLIETVLAEHVSGIKVLLAPPPADLSAPLSLPQVQHIVVMLQRMFPWVIVDLGLPLNETAFAFLDGADRIIMTVLPEMVGLRNTKLMLDQIYDRGYPPERVQLVLNRATLRGGVTMSDIEERLRVPIRYTVPDDQPLVTHSVNRGVPLIISHQRTAVAKAVQKIARAVRSDLLNGGHSEAPDVAPAASTGFFRRLFGQR